MTSRREQHAGDGRVTREPLQRLVRQRATSDDETVGQPDGERPGRAARSWSRPRIRSAWPRRRAIVSTVITGTCVRLGRCADEQVWPHAVLCRQVTAVQLTTGELDQRIGVPLTG